MNYAGIDIGSSACKAAVFDEGGRPLASSHRSYAPVFTPDGGVELEPDKVIASCFEVMREAAAQVPADSINGIGISSQGEAFTPVGRDGLALHNAMISSDGRSAPYIESSAREFGADRLYRITGHTAHPMFSLFKLLWLKRTKPDVWREARRFLCFEDLLELRLGLEPAMGWPLAGRTMLFDVRTHRWNQGILDFAGLAHEQLARPLRSGSPSGPIPAAVASQLGLRTGALVVTGGHDQVMGALGAGVTRPGIAMYATGTVDCITPAFDEPVFSPDLQKSNLCTYDHAAPGMYATIAYSLTGGNILTWFRDRFGAPELDQAARTGGNAYELLLSAAETKPARAMVLPYFSPSGTPYFDSRVAGALLGLRLSTTRGEIIRALLEGVAFEMRLNLDILERAGCRVQELRAIGGGAKSRFWNQLKADVVGKPIVVPAVTEAGCLGGAMLACAADTGAAVRDLAATWVKCDSAVEPDPALAEWYTERFNTYRQIYPALKRIDD